jgi:hypothetical protein
MAWAWHAFGKIEGEDRKEKGKDMKDDKDPRKTVSTCLEGSPCAEMMQKILGEEGMGSLCEEMMRTVMSKLRDAEADPKDPADDRRSK